MESDDSSDFYFLFLDKYNNARHQGIATHIQKLNQLYNRNYSEVSTKFKKLVQERVYIELNMIRTKFYLVRTNKIITMVLWTRVGL